MVVEYGPDFDPRRKVYPTKAEYKLPLDKFIYCSNSGCGLAGSGICRTRIGDNQNSHCRQCKVKFPTKANGKTFGGHHFAALKAGIPEPKSGNGGGGRPRGGKAGGSAGGTDDRILSLEKSVRSLAGSLEKMVGATADGSAWPPLQRDMGSQNGGIPPGTRWGAHRRMERAEPAPTEVDRTSQAVVTSQADNALGGPNHLVDSVAAQYSIPSEAAEKIAAIIKESSPPIPARHVKPTAAAHALHEKHQVAFKSVQTIRGSQVKAADRLESALAEVRDSQKELVDLEGQMQSAKQALHETFEAMVEFEKSQNSITANALAPVPVPAAATPKWTEPESATDVFQLAHQLIKATEGNPLYNQVGEQLRAIYLASNPAPPAQPEQPAKSASEQGSQVRTVESTALDAHMGQPVKRAGESGDEQANDAWKKRLADGDLDSAQAALQATRAGLAAATPLPTANAFGALQSGDIDSDVEEPVELGDLDPNDQGQSK